MRRKGIVLYEGPSLLNKQPIVCIATLESANRKTGNVIQTWIIRQRVNPVHAMLNRAVASICGDCPLSGTVCYVIEKHAPLAVYSKYKANRYPHYNWKLHKPLFEGRVIRWGAYGDPAALPLSLVRYYNGLCNGHLGYSHQLLNGTYVNRHRADKLAKLFMVSAHNRPMADKAYARGHRFFQTVTSPSEAHPSAIKCPSDRVQCVKCGLCNGSSGNGRSVWIEAHGFGAGKLAEVGNAS